MTKREEEEERAKKSAVERLIQTQAAEVPTPAPEPVRVPAPIPELPEPERPSFLSRLASMAPSLVGGIGHMAGAGSGTQESRGTLARLMQQGNEEIATADQRYTAQRRANARNRQQQAAAQAAAKRQAGLDAENAKTNALKREEMGLNIVKGRRTEADAAEADDYNSPRNRTFTETFKKAEPEAWAALPPEVQARGLRLKDAESLSLILADSKRRKGKEDSKELETHKQREELRYNTNLPGGFGYNPGPATGQPGRATEDAAAAYGGIENVPAHIKAAARTVDEAFAAGRKDTPQLHTALMDDVAADLQRAKGNTVAEAKADEAMRRTSVMEDKDYSDARQRRNLDRLRANLDAVKKALEPYIGPDGKPKKDIPGYGTTGWLPNFMKSEEGKSLAQAYARLQDTELRSVSGAAAPEQEVQRFGNIMGTGALSTDRDLVNALEKAEAVLSQQESFLDAGRPAAAERFRQRLSKGTPAAAHANQKGSGSLIKVRNPKTGEVRELPPNLAKIAIEERDWVQAN